ncbi:MAG: hypothetical protein AB1650_05505 [Candidatus Omnitrophota bacterium]
MSRNKFGQWFFAAVLFVVFSGCTAAPKGEKAEVPYETKLLIGMERDDILRAAEKVFGKPKQTGSIFPDSDYEVELRRYWFTNVSDFVMYFHRNIFIQAGLMPVESPEYPALRSDYQGITSEKPGPVLGYSVFMNKEEVVLDTIHP